MDRTLANDVKSAFSLALQEAFPGIEALQVAIAVANPKFGDYQCNAAMAIFKNYKDALGDAKTPKDVADKICAALKKELFSDVTVAKQGFITVRLAPDILKNYLLDELDGKLDAAKPEPRRCLVDYSSPNIAKEMHVGHLRSTILGEAICRILEYAGHNVLRVNHLGDWGTQFGMLIEYMRETYSDFQSNPPNLTDLTVFYREAKKKFDEDETFKRKAQLAVPQLQGGEPSARAAWKMFCDISRADFQKIYDRFGVSLIERGESFYNDMIPDVVKDVEQKGLMTISDGAKCFFVQDDNVPLIIVKSDGGYGYDTTDLAAIKHRLVIEKHDRLIYVTDIGQETHFHKIFKAAQAMGWHVPPKTRCDHVGFGLVQGEDGKKFKTRSGDLVKLTDLLDEAVERAVNEIRRRRAEEGSGEQQNNTEVDEEDTQSTAEAIGYAAIRYFDLKQNRISNYRFSFDKMLDPKGNTAVYLLYAYARICAIFRKAEIDASSLDKTALTLNQPQERDLALQMLKFYDVLNSVLEDMYVHRLAEYMYELSGAFTTFYQHCKVVGDPQQESRLLLCELTRRFLGKAFHLLGITPLQKL